MIISVTSSWIAKISARSRSYRSAHKSPGIAIDQLGCDPDAVARPLDAPLKHIVNAQFPAHILYSYWLALVSKGRVAGDDKEVAKPGKPCNDILGNTIGEKILRRIATHVDEGQKSDGGLVGSCLNGRGYGGHTGNAISSNRLSDILQILDTNIVETDLDLALCVVLCGARDQDAARFSDGLKSRCNVDALAVKVAAFDHDVAETDTDTENDMSAFGLVAAGGPHSLLKFDRASHSVDRAGELDQY